MAGDTITVNSLLEHGLINLPWHFKVNYGEALNIFVIRTIVETNMRRRTHGRTVGGMADTWNEKKSVFLPIEMLSDAAATWQGCSSSAHSTSSKEKRNHNRHENRVVPRFIKPHGARHADAPTRNRARWIKGIAYIWPRRDDSDWTWWRSSAALSQRR